jgi:hypothetical protein
MNERICIECGMDEEQAAYCTGADWSQFLPMTDHVLEALRSRGYAIVPIAATGPMLDAGAQFVPDHDRADFAFGVACSDVAEIWTAMIEASAASVAPAKAT